MDNSCASMLRFSLWRQMAPQQSAKFITAFFSQFRTSLRKDSVANYGSIWTTLSSSVTGPDVLCLLRTKHFAYPSVGDATRFAELRSIAPVFTKRKQSDAEFAGNITYGYY